MGTPQPSQRFLLPSCTLHLYFKLEESASFILLDYATILLRVNTFKVRFETPTPLSFKGKYPTCVIGALRAMWE